MPLGVYGIDPGASNIGVGVILTGNGRPVRDALIANEPVAVWRKLEWWIQTTTGQYGDRHMRWVVVVENYTGAGFRDRDSVVTLHQVGYFKHRCTEAGLTVVTPEPGARKRALQWAYDQLEVVRGVGHDPDHVSALAHAKAYLEREGVHL